MEADYGMEVQVSTFLDMLRSWLRACSCMCSSSVTCLRFTPSLGPTLPDQGSDS